MRYPELSNYFNINPAWLMGAEDVDKYLNEINELEHRKVPVLGRIAAGTPILSQENIEDYEYVNEKSKVDFCLRVNGDSMINARIYDGDIVYIRQQPDVENGEIAAIRIDGEEVTLKRVYKYPGTIILRPENSKYEEIVFNKKDFKQIDIIGKCVAVKFCLE